MLPGIVISFCVCVCVHVNIPAVCVSALTAAVLLPDFSPPLVFVFYSNTHLRAYLSETAWKIKLASPPSFIPNNNNIMCLHEYVITHTNQDTAATWGEF